MAHGLFNVVKAALALPKHPTGEYGPQDFVDEIVDLRRTRTFREALEFEDDRAPKPAAGVKSGRWSTLVPTVVYLMRNGSRIQEKLQGILVNDDDDQNWNVAETVAKARLMHARIAPMHALGTGCAAPGN